MMMMMIIIFSIKTENENLNESVYPTVGRKLSPQSRIPTESKLNKEDLEIERGADTLGTSNLIIEKIGRSKETQSMTFNNK